MHSFLLLVRISSSSSSLPIQLLQVNLTASTVKLGQLLRKKKWLMPINVTCTLNGKTKLQPTITIMIFTRQQIMIQQQIQPITGPSLIQHGMVQPQRQELIFVSRNGSCLLLQLHASKWQEKQKDCGRHLTLLMTSTLTTSTTQSPLNSVEVVTLSMRTEDFQQSPYPLQHLKNLKLLERELCQLRSSSPQLLPS